MRKKKPDRILRADVQQLIKKWQLGQTLTFTARGVLSPQSPCRPPPLSADFRSLMECSPSPSSQDPFDVVTLIDVIEHMPIRSTCCWRIKSVMAPDGICLVVTPDVGSVAARAMGWKWWRFHAAHIGYFEQVDACLGAGDGGAARQRDYTAVVALAFEPPGRTGVQLPPSAVSSDSAFSSGSNCCPDQFV